MAIGTRIGPDGRPIEDPFFQTSLPGLGQQLASLPGTPILPGAAGGTPSAPGGYEQPGVQGLGVLVEPVPFLAELAQRGVRSAVFEGVPVA